MQPGFTDQELFDFLALLAADADDKVIDYGSHALMALPDGGYTDATHLVLWAVTHELVADTTWLPRHRGAYTHHKLSADGKMHLERLAKRLGTNVDA